MCIPCGVHKFSVYCCRFETLHLSPKLREMCDARRKFSYCFQILNRACATILSTTTLTYLQHGKTGKYRRDTSLAIFVSLRRANIFFLLCRCNVVSCLSRNEIVPPPKLIVLLQQLRRRIPHRVVVRKI